MSLLRGRYGTAVDATKDALASSILASTMASVSGVDVGSHCRGRRLTVAACHYQRKQHKSQYRHGCMSLPNEHKPASGGGIA